MQLNVERVCQNQEMRQRVVDKPGAGAGSVATAVRSATARHVHGNLEVAKPAIQIRRKSRDRTIGRTFCMLCSRRGSGSGSRRVAEFHSNCPCHIGPGYNDVMTRRNEIPSFRVTEEVPVITKLAA